MVKVRLKYCATAFFQSLPQRGVPVGTGIAVAGSGVEEAGCSVAVDEENGVGEARQPASDPARSIDNRGK